MKQKKMTEKTHDSNKNTLIFQSSFMDSSTRCFFALNFRTRYINNVNVKSPHSRQSLQKDATRQDDC